MTSKKATDYEDVTDTDINIIFDTTPKVVNVGTNLKLSAVVQSDYPVKRVELWVDGVYIGDMTEL